MTGYRQRCDGSATGGCRRKFNRNTIILITAPRLLFTKVSQLLSSQHIICKQGKVNSCLTILFCNHTIQEYLFLHSQYRQLFLQFLKVILFELADFICFLSLCSCSMKSISSFTLFLSLSFSEALFLLLYSGHH